MGEIVCKSRLWLWGNVLSCFPNLQKASSHHCGGESRFKASYALTALGGHHC